MKLTFELKEVPELTHQEESMICQIAADGFCRSNDTVMQSDTMEHIRHADNVQLAYDGRELVAFSLYGRSLWQSSN
jgi:hypothetical protein